MSRHPEADLSALLSAAEVLAFPSLAEGFGLPILDAWKTGAAVLTSDRTSLPEVAGDAALLVDPTDTDAIAAGLTRLMSDPAERARLVRRGALRVNLFNWESTAARFALSRSQASTQSERPRIGAGGARAGCARLIPASRADQAPHKACRPRY